ncbi:helix-turn-helix domain-containing protein [Streptomyces sp. NPDC002680]|uniref:helix-turn-helix domain-containing protein n=1 Tax=Streptomyces sp. NPDC002680 TaxID=3364659 RepID=UPI0036CC3F42
MPIPLDAAQPPTPYVSPGGDSIPEFGFNAPDAPVPGLEMVDLATLRRRVQGGRLHRVHRVDFHTITLVTRGGGEHTVDFVDYPCRPGTLLWVRPGQAQRFGTTDEHDPEAKLNGPHLIFTADFPPEFSAADRLITDWFGPVCWQLGTGREYARVSGLLAQLAAEYTSSQGTVSREILRLLLATLMLHIDRLPRPGTDPRSAGEVYARFHAELERSYATTRRAEDYAARLGYSVKTLSRVCLAATGQPVKCVINARVVLQAQRLLAHTDDPVALVSQQLGFSEPTNFGKFFARYTGTTPGDFRRAHREET